MASSHGRHCTCIAAIAGGTSPSKRRRNASWLAAAARTRWAAISQTRLNRMSSVSMAFNRCQQLVADAVDLRFGHRSREREGEAGVAERFRHRKIAAREAE